MSGVMNVRFYIPTPLAQEGVPFQDGAPAPGAPPPIKPASRSGRVTTRVTNHALHQRGTRHPQKGRTPQIGTVTSEGCQIKVV